MVSRGMPGSKGAVSVIYLVILGLMMVVVVYHCVVAAGYELPPLFRTFVYGRPAVIVCFAGFALLGMAEPVLVLFGGIDLLGAIWTAFALRSSQQSI